MVSEDQINPQLAKLTDFGPVRLGDLVENSTSRYFAELLGLDTEEATNQSRELFLEHQFRMLAESGEIPEEVILQLIGGFGCDIRTYPTNVEFDGPFGKQMAFGDFSLNRWITKYVIDNVFGSFLQFGDQLEFSSEHYTRGWRNERIPEDDSIDEFLARQKTYQPHQIAFFNQSLENDTIYLASDLRFGDLNGNQREELLGRVNDYLTGLIYSEVCYPGNFNPFGPAINWLLRATIILDPKFKHPFVGESAVYYHERDEDGYFPSGYWTLNPIGKREYIFLGKSQFDGCRDLLPDGVKAKIIGGRGLASVYYALGELVEFVE